MEKMRTMALQIPEDLFLELKEYLKTNNLTQKEFILNLIKTAIEENLSDE